MGFTNQTTILDKKKAKYIMYWGEHCRSIVMGTAVGSVRFGGDNGRVKPDDEGLD